MDFHRVLGNRTVTLFTTLGQDDVDQFCGMCGQRIQPESLILKATHEHFYGKHKVGEYVEDLHVGCLPDRIEWMYQNSLLSTEFLLAT